MTKKMHSRIWKWSALPLILFIPSFVLSEFVLTSPILVLFFGFFGMINLLIFVIMFWFIGVMGAVLAMAKPGVVASVESAPEGSLEHGFHSAARDGFAFFELIGMVPEDGEHKSNEKKS